MSDQLPRVLEEGDTLRFGWNLDEIRAVAEAAHWKGFLYVHVMDVLGNWYEGAYPGVKVGRRLPWGKMKYELDKVIFGGSQPVQRAESQPNKPSQED